jgi:O-antigen/teichoic acid export membrane protein
MPVRNQVGAIVGLGLLVASFACAVGVDDVTWALWLGLAGVLVLAVSVYNTEWWDGAPLGDEGEDDEEGRDE